MRILSRLYRMAERAAPEAYHKLQRKWWALRSLIHGARLPFIRGYRRGKRFVIRNGRKVRRMLMKTLRETWWALRRRVLGVKRSLIRGYRKVKRSLIQGWRRLKRMKLRDVFARRTKPVYIAGTQVKNGHDMKLEGFTNEWVRLPQEEFARRTDAGFLDKVRPALEELPVSNGGRYYEKHKPVIGIVADEFLFDSIKDAADFRFLPPEGWEPMIEGIELLLIVSAWKGIGEEWRGAAKEGSDRRETLYRIIGDCKKRGIPTAFYSKEDPPNYEHFLGLAQASDYIFTTCVEVTDNYRKDCHNEHVGVLKFGINPLFHNPVGMRSEGKREGVIFSGSWMNKYPERQVDMKMLLEGVLHSGKPLKIVDRNFDRSPVSYRYPPEYWPYLSPAIPHDLLQKVHKLYDYALNINTVKGSRTMFANRGYELQGGGNLLLSNYSCGVNEQLPTVLIAHSADDVEHILRTLTPEEVYERQIAGIREMMTGNTCFDRIGELLEAVGLERTVTQRRVLVIATANTAHVQAMFERQSYPWRTLICEADVTQEIYDAYDLIAFFDDQMEYEMFYLEDMVNGFKYTASSYVTKAAYFKGNELVPGVEHGYVKAVGSRYRTVFWREDFALAELLAMQDNTPAENGYSIDHFNYHADVWNGAERDSSDKAITVLIPVHGGSGVVPYAKAFSSVRCSSMFDRLSVLFVVDPQAEKLAADRMAYIARRYGNVSVLAAQTIDEALAQVKTPYLHVLSAEYEVIADGLRRMYEQAEQNGADMQFADALICRQGVESVRRTEIPKGEGRASVPEEMLDASVCLIRTSLAQKCGTCDLRSLIQAAESMAVVNEAVCAEYQQY